MTMNNALAGAGIVVARATGRGERLCARIEAAGGNALCVPVIAIQPPHDIRLPDDAPDWLIFTSVAAVEYGIPAVGARIGHAGCAAIGKATAAALRAAGIEPEIVPAREESEGLLDMPAFREVAGRNIWLVKGGGGRELLADTLRERGADVKPVEVYARALPATDIEPLLERWRARGVDAVVVSSRAALENLHAMLNAEGRRYLGETQLVVPTERMLKLALELDIRPAPLIARNASDDALLAALSDWWRGRLQDSR